MEECFFQCKLEYKEEYVNAEAETKFLNTKVFAYPVCIAPLMFLQAFMTATETS